MYHDMIFCLNQMATHKTGLILVQIVGISKIAATFPCFSNNTRKLVLLLCLLDQTFTIIIILSI